MPVRVKQILGSKEPGDVVTVTPETRIADVLALLSSRRIGGVVVSASGDTADGILSERDIVRALHERGASVLDEQSDALMTANPVCAAPGDNSDAVLQQMTEGRFRHMPVVESGKLVGIITIGDVVKSRIDELANDNYAMQAMIMGA